MLDNEQQAIIFALEASLKAKASADPAFRAELLADPRAVVSRLLGFELPASYKLEVKEAPADTHVVMLPALHDGELSDSDLEAVAGGKLTIKEKFQQGHVFDGMVDSLWIGAFTAGYGTMGCAIEAAVSVPH